MARRAAISRIGWPIGLVAVCLTMGAGVLQADARSDARQQLAFGISMAQRGLWTEALYRWQRAAEIDPTYAAAFNNLAVAYEQDGKLDLAQESYEKALQLEPENVMIRQNYELFREINERAERQNR